MAAKATTATATTAKKAAAPVAAAPVAAAPVALPAAAAPLYTCYPYNGTNGWPAKSAGGATVRSYCYQVATQLAKANPQGFTLAQYASAIAANAANSTIAAVARNNWGTAAQPSGKARQHAAWFAAPAQAWLVPVAGNPRAN